MSDKCETEKEKEQKSELQKKIVVTHCFIIKWLVGLAVLSVISIIGIAIGFHDVVATLSLLGVSICSIIAIIILSNHCVSIFGNTDDE